MITTLHKATVIPHGAGNSWAAALVDKTHQKARSEAQPATVTEPLPAGQAARGWLWILLVAAIGALLVRALM